MMRPPFLLFLLLLFLSTAALAEPAPQLPVSGLGEYENYLRFDASGRYLMMDDQNGLRVWDVRNLKLIDHVKAPRILETDVSSDGHFLAIGSHPRTIQVLDIRTGKTVMQFSKAAGAPEYPGGYAVSFSPDGRYLMAHGSTRGRENVDTTVRVWNTATWQIVGERESPEAAWEPWTWTPWGELAQLGKDGRTVDLYKPEGFAARSIGLPEEAANLRVEAGDLIAFMGTDEQKVRQQRLADGETTPRVEVVDMYQSTDEGMFLTRVPGGLWTSMTGYGGPCAIFRGPKAEVKLGHLDWASGPPTASSDGNLLAIPTRKGILVLDVPATVAQGRLVPLRSPKAVK